MKKCVNFLTFADNSPGGRRNVYYRDEIGNISTSRLRVMDDAVEVEVSFWFLKGFSFQLFLVSKFFYLMKLLRSPRVSRSTEDGRQTTRLATRSRLTNICIKRAVSVEIL